MKKLLITTILIFLFILGLSGAAWAESVELKWDANTETDLAGYKIYTGISTGLYDSSIDVGNVTSYALEAITDIFTHYYAVTAYDTSGNESGYSNEVSFLYVDTSPPNTPTSLIILIQ